MKRFICIWLLFSLPMLWWSSCDDTSSEVDFNPNVSASKDYIRAEDAIMEIVNSFFKGLNDVIRVFLDKAKCIPGGRLCSSPGCSNVEDIPVPSFETVIGHGYDPEFIFKNLILNHTQGITDIFF